MVRRIPTRRGVERGERAGGDRARSALRNRRRRAARRARDRVARRLRLPAHLREQRAVHRPLRLAGAAELAAAPPHRAAGPGPARALVRAPGRHTVEGVLVGHTHFDHAVDAPALARRSGCNAYGSESLARLMGLHGLREQAVVVDAVRDLRARPVRGLVHALAALAPAARRPRPLRRRAHLRPPRRAQPRRLPLRAGLGDHDRGRRHHALPPGQRRPDRRRAAPAGDPHGRCRRLPRRRRRAQLHRALLGADPAAGWTRR